MAKSSPAYFCNHSFSFFFATFIVFLSINIGGATSETFTVGDDEEWDSGVNYNEWSQKYNFTAGDILVFKYLKTQHNVYEVTETTFRSCDPSSGVLKKYDTGDDQVALGEVGKYWFICNVGGHCLGGMRFGVEVRNKTSSAGDGAPMSLPSPEPPSPAGSNGGSRARGFGQWNVGEGYLVVLGIMLRLLV